MRLLVSEFLAFLRYLSANRHLLAALTKRHFKTRYLGSYLGLLWAFLQPVITVLMFWFVFQVALGIPTRHQVPFILYLLTGLVPWQFFSTSLSAGTQSIVTNASLVTHIVFRLSMLPLATILSNLIIHGFFLVLTVVLFAAYGYAPSLHNLQVVYYTVASIVLLMGLAWATSSLVVFLKDLTPTIMLFLQFGFWMIPVVWDVDHITKTHPRVIGLLKLNPMYYIVQGYRDAFIDKQWFWERGPYTIYFWCVTLAIFVFGAVIFRRLRPHFGDML